MVVTVLCDWIGGQRGITLSDSIQAGFMLLSFFTMPFVVAHEFRPFADLMSDCTTGDCIPLRRPWFLKTPNVLGTCLLNENATDPDCFRSHFNSTQECVTRPLPLAGADRIGRLAVVHSPCLASSRTRVDRYADGVELWGLNPDERTIFDHQTLSMLGFIMNGFAFPVQTHFLQKLFLARSEGVIRYVWSPIAIFAMCAISPFFSRFGVSI
jgi:hypothetical protein